MATSLTSGEVTKKANVTPRGMPPFTKPINSGTDEHEQKGLPLRTNSPLDIQNHKALFLKENFLLCQSENSYLLSPSKR